MNIANENIMHLCRIIGQQKANYFEEHGCCPFKVNRDYETNEHCLKVNEDCNKCTKVYEDFITEELFEHYRVEDNNTIGC